MLIHQILTDELNRKYVLYHFEIIEFRDASSIIVCLPTKTQEKQYEAQWKDTVVDGKTKTNFIFMTGRMLQHSIDRTRKTLGEGS